MESLYKLLQKQEPLKQKKFKTTTKKLIERATMKPSVDAGTDAGTDAGAGADVGADAGTDAGTDAGADAGSKKGIAKKINITKSTDEFNIENYMAKLRQKNLRVFKSKKNQQKDGSNKLQRKVDELEKIIEKREKDLEQEKKEDVNDGESKTARKTRKRTRPVVAPSFDPEVLIETDTSRLQLVEINGEPILSRFPEKMSHINLKSSQYHLNNRETFLNFINTVFAPYRIESQKDDDSVSCKNINDTKKSGKFSLLLHQKLVRDYLNINTPYRGLFLYFGLGAGKTCSSIAIAEGLKDFNKIIIMTPASLQQNYINEIKFCGDFIFKKNQRWDFIKADGNVHIIEALSHFLGIPKDYVEKKNGAWLIDVRKESNFLNDLTNDEQKEIENQIDIMIRNKYHFINYNGLRKERFEQMERDGEAKGGNFFNDTVVIIDEAHNFVSRIVNKLNQGGVINTDGTVGGRKKNAASDSISMKLYHYLMDADNCRIVFLTGTPVINYPNEIAVFFNMLRGYIKTYTLKLQRNSKSRIKKLNLPVIKKMLKGNNIDYIDFKPSTNTLTITKNPFNFTNKYRDKEYIGVEVKKESSDIDFLKKIIKSLSRFKIKVETPIKRPEKFKCLPDNIDNFTNLFINQKTNKLKNTVMLQKRILGLTSYFKSADEKLLPKFDKIEDVVEIRVEMSSYQLGIYEKARVAERKEEKRNAVNLKGNKVANLYSESTSTYRIFSRAFCNFVFPSEIRRPMPNDKILEDTGEAGGDAGAGAGETGAVEVELLDTGGGESKKNTFKVKDFNKDAVHFFNEGGIESDVKLIDADDSKQPDRASKAALYLERIQFALQKLATNGETYLSGDGLQQLSPKFHKVIDIINDVENRGTHLIYSNFRTIEGIGILKLVLEANGFVQLKIGKNKTSSNKAIYPEIPINEYVITNLEEVRANDSFALFTGTETVEVKDITRLIFNSQWDKLNPFIKVQLNTIHSNNYYGEIAKCFMITSAGAEGITLKNTRYVHLIEPYWHPVRKQQVIGRAVRICSHEDLPERDRNVKVFKYLAVLSDKQIYGDPKSSDPKDKDPMISTEMRLKDVSKIDKKTVLTSDQALDEISGIKESINEEILFAIKSTSIDCKIHNKPGSPEYAQCFSVTSAKSDKFIYKPSYGKDEKDDARQINVRKVESKGEIEMNIPGMGKVMVDASYKKTKTGFIYDWEDYKASNIKRKIGKLEPHPTKKGKTVIKKYKN